MSLTVNQYKNETSYLHKESVYTNKGFRILFTLDYSPVVQEQACLVLNISKRVVFENRPVVYPTVLDTVI